MGVKTDVQRLNDRMLASASENLARMIQQVSGDVTQHGRIGVDLSIVGGKITLCRTIDERTIKPAS